MTTTTKTRLAHQLPLDPNPKRSQFFMGLDLGQAQDYTAIVIVERVRRVVSETKEAPIGSGSGSGSGQNEPLDEYHLRYCERLPRGTSYQDVTVHVKDLFRRFEDDGSSKRVTLIVDATGIGRPVIDSLKADGLMPVPITVTGGQNVNHDDTGWRVPKRDLVSSAKVLLGKRQLKMAKGMPLVDTLIRELENFHVKINIATGHDTYEAWKENDHDDLVFALSIAVWWATIQKKKFLDIDARDVICDTAEGAVHPEDDYRIGWVPARAEEHGVLVIYNIDHQAIVLLQRTKYESMQQQIDTVFQVAQRYQAMVRAQAGADESILKTLERRGAYVRRVELPLEKPMLAYENLALLISYQQIKLPNDPELLAEFELCDPYESSAVRALCLVTHDVHPLESDFYDEQYDEYDDFYDDDY